MKAAVKGHLTVLQKLIEQYGGNVLHRNKVMCIVTSDFRDALTISHYRRDFGMITTQYRMKTVWMFFHG